MECKGKCPFCTEPCPWDHCSWKEEDNQEKEKTPEVNHQEENKVERQ